MTTSSREVLLSDGRCAHAYHLPVGDTKIAACGRNSQADKEFNRVTEQEARNKGHHRCGKCPFPDEPDDELDRGGGVIADGGVAATDSPLVGNDAYRNDEEHQLVRTLRTVEGGYLCPDCGRNISATAGIHRLTNYHITLGHACESCQNLVPVRLDERHTPSLSDIEAFSELVVYLRDGSIVPIPAREVVQNGG